MNGKDKCELLKDIRLKMAKEYGLDIKMDDCTHEGDCRGTCPKCDEELKNLERQMKEKKLIRLHFLKFWEGQKNDVEFYIYK